MCICLPDFYGDPRRRCNVCESPNARPACELQASSLPEIRGRCIAVDGSAVGGPCRSTADCPDASTYGCFGYQAAVTPDAPCACTDLRGLDMSQAKDLSDVALAWYDAETKWPPGFDATRSGALGPSAQLPGIGLSGSRRAAPVRGGEVLVPTEPYDGTQTSAEYPNDQALENTPVRPGTVRLDVGGEPLTDAREPGTLTSPDSDTPRGKVDYDSGQVEVTALAKAPDEDAETRATYDRRVVGKPLRPARPFNGTRRQARVAGKDAVEAPIKPGSVKVRLRPERMIPDEPFDGVTPSKKFRRRPILNLPIRPKLFKVKLTKPEAFLWDKDGLTDCFSGEPSGTLYDEAGLDRGCVNYRTGEVDIDFAEAPAEDGIATADYDYCVEGPVELDRTADGQRSRFTLTGTKAIDRAPIIAGTVSLKIGSTTYSDPNQDGVLRGDDGGAGEVQYLTGDLIVQMRRAPRPDAVVLLTYCVDGDTVLSDAQESGSLRGKGGNGGAIDYATGTLDLSLDPAPSDDAEILIDFDTPASETLATVPPPDGISTSLTAKLQEGDLVPGTVEISLGPESLVPDPPLDGTMTQFCLEGDSGLSKPPVSPGTLLLTIGSQQLADDASGGL